MRSAPILLHISTSRARIAVGRSVPGGFLVYAGSRAAADPKPSTPASALRVRTALVDAGVLVPAEDGQLAFAQDFVFNTASSAAFVVMGLAANGKTQWKPLA